MHKRAQKRISSAIVVLFMLLIAVFTLAPTTALAAQEMIIDDSAATYTGTWASSSSVPGYFGNGYRYHAAGTGVNKVTWGFTVPAAGPWEVYARWTSAANRASDAMYVVHSAYGTTGRPDGNYTEVTVDQQADGGSWQLLGTYYFEAVAYSVSLSDGANGMVIADAIKLVQVDSDYAYYISEKKATIIRYLGNGGAVTIPSTLGWYPTVAIGDETSIAGMAIGAFERCATLTSVTIPDSITHIGGSAFAETPLTSVVIPDGVTIVGEAAFYRCASLASVTLSNSMQGIADWTFSGCSSLSSITIPEGIDGIGMQAFGGCASLVSLNLPDSVGMLWYYAFVGCTSLTWVRVGTGMEWIEDGAFSGCTSLTSIAFRGVLAPTTVYPGATWIEDTSFYLRGHAREDSNFPAPGSVWNGLTMGDYVDGDYLYAVQNGNATVTGYIGSGGDISIPSTLGGHPVVTIGTNAFEMVGNDGYQFHSGLTLTSAIIPYGVTTIDTRGFWGNPWMTSVTIPESVTYIGESAFSGHHLSGSGLTSVIIPDSVTYLGTGAFQNCFDLTSAALGNGITSIEDYTFSVTALNSVNIPEGVTSIGEAAFSGSGLNSVTLSDNVSSIGAYAFAFCPRLATVSIGSGAISIGDYAFFNCSGMTWIEVSPDNPKYASLDGILYDKAISTLIYCPGGRVGPVIIPDGVSLIGMNAFYECGYLTSVDIPSSVASIGGDAFYGCISLTSITFQGLVAPTVVGSGWIMDTPTEIRGHAYAASNFPAPGQIWNGLMMGSVIPVSNTPSAPLELAATPGDAKIMLTWSAPASDGGSPVAYYRIWRGTTPGALSVLTTRGDVLTWTDSSVSNGVTYYYRVAAINANGVGELSSEVTATSSHLPSAPQNFRATAGDHKVTLTWSAPASDGGSAIQYYRIWRGTASGALSVLTTRGNVLTWTNTGLTNGVTYYYKVTAINANGVGSLSSEESATPSASVPDVPSAPQNFLATAGDHKVTLTWSAPASTGGSPVAYYRIWRGTMSGELSVLTTRGNVLTWTDTSVSNGHTYFYKVAPINANGVGAFSIERSATPGP